jgi:hypothetical protein
MSADTKPTREQIEAARARLQWLLDKVFDDQFAPDLRVLLAATAPSTDEDLVKEAEQFAVGSKSPRVAVLHYVAGARREGRR